MCQGRFFREGEMRTAWHPIGLGDPDSVWIETEEDRENKEEIKETIIETEEEIETETEKENK